jgi:hypothetical protein
MSLQLFDHWEVLRLSAKDFPWLLEDTRQQKDANDRIYAQPDFTSQAMASRDAESLLRDVELAPSGPVGSNAPDQAQSN